jgi:hypothetical protein
MPRQTRTEHPLELYILSATVGLTLLLVAFTPTLSSAPMP